LKTVKSGGKLKLLVLVPHRDTRVILRKWSAPLAAGSFESVSFPYIAPLAVISRYFNKDELKHCAAVLRKAGAEKFKTISAGNERAVISGALLKGGTAPRGEAAVNEDAGYSIIGPELDFAFPRGFFYNEAKVIKIYNKVLIGCLLQLERENPQTTEQLPPLQHFSFGAAAVANMCLRITERDGFCLSQWKIGKLHWLPKIK